MNSHDVRGALGLAIEIRHDSQCIVCYSKGRFRVSVGVIYRRCGLEIDKGEVLCVNSPNKS